jgi:branched-chain amino acid transport system ATP-binding protein
MTAGASALECSGIVAGYEPGLPIVRGASISVAPGEIFAILGPNGAGKSTLVKAIAGLVPILSGTVTLHGDDITTAPAHMMVRRGLAFVPQTENIFANLTVEDNIDLAASVMKVNKRLRLPEIYGLFPDLARQKRLPAGRLSGGQRQMLACARALVTKPRVLMLDEPSAGLSPKLVALVFEKLREARAGGVTIVLVEQNVKAALALADRATVLVEGKERITGRAADLMNDGALAELYFGHGGAGKAA